MDGEGGVEAMSATDEASRMVFIDDGDGTNEAAGMVMAVAHPSKDKILLMEQSEQMSMC